VAKRETREIDLYPGEDWVQTVDFAGVLLPAESIVNADKTRVHDADGNEVTGDVIPGGASAVGDTVQYEIDSDLALLGQTYVIYALATLDTNPEQTIGQRIIVRLPKA
jgi:hypothetical protein